MSIEKKEKNLIFIKKQIKKQNLKVDNIFNIKFKTDIDGDNYINFIKGLFLIIFKIMNNDKIVNDIESKLKNIPVNLKEFETFLN